MTTNKFSEFLGSKYQERLVRNPNYSMRSFSRDLGLSSGRLTNFLKGRDLPGPETYRRISFNLKLEPQECKKIAASLETERYLRRGRGFSKQLSEQEFALIKDPRTWSIYTLFQSADFKPQLSWFVTKLGLTETDIKASLEKLIQVGLIEAHGDFYQVIYPNVTTTNNVPSQQIRDFHRNFMALAEKSLDAVPVELRDVSSITMCLDQSKLPELKKVIAEFRARVEEIGQGTNSSELYQLNIQLFPLQGLS